MPAWSPPPRVQAEANELLKLYVAVMAHDADSVEAFTAVYSISNVQLPHLLSRCEASRPHYHRHVSVFEQEQRGLRTAAALKRGAAAH